MYLEYLVGFKKEGGNCIGDAALALEACRSHFLLFHQTHIFIVIL